MAKVGKLAGLAALAGAAYMMSKGKDKEKGTTDSNPTRAARPESTENRLESPEDTIKRSMKKAPLDGTEMYPSGVMGGAKMANAAKPAKSSAESDKTSLRDAEADKSRGSRPSTNTSSSSEDGMRNYSTRSGSLAGAGRGSVNPSMVTPSSPRDSETGMSRGTRAASTEDGMKNYKPRYTPPMLAPKTTQGNGRKPYMPEDVDMSIGQKRGGMVKKMASGGMTASRRADGIATKGKTRGKIC